MTVPSVTQAIRAARASLDAEIEHQRSDGSIPGLVLAVTDRERTLIDARYGVAEVGIDRPVAPDTLFEIGSIGKTFTALAILALEAEGRLRVDDPVVRHLPWFRVPRTGDRITIHHLLSHTAGITAGTEGTPEARAQVWRLRDLLPGSAPGRRFHYSNVGYKVLGLVIEAIEGEPYPDVIRRRLLGPLGMTASEPAITNVIRHRMAVGYAPARDDLPWTEGDPLAPATWLVTGTADGSIASTAADMATFIRALMRDPTGYVTRMSTAVPGMGDDTFRYGYGLMRREVNGRSYLGHTGGMVGFISGMAWDPEAGLGAIVLQSGPGHGPNALARLAIRRTLAALDGRDPDAERPEVFGNADDGDEPIPADPRWLVPDGDAMRLVGTYRSHDPWNPRFRIEVRDHVLWLTSVSDADGIDPEQPLFPMARGWYRLGADRLGPERIRFDLEIEGRAVRARLSGWPYYRVDDATG